MYLMIDNYDSFVYNLRAYFQEIGREILVKRCDELSLEDIENLQPEGIILSPGPKRPQDAFLCVEALKQFQGKIPVLGVCLGHQVIGYCSGASVQKGRTPMHGKITAIRHNGTGCFAGLPETFSVTRYHSLTVQPNSLPDTYRIECQSRRTVQSWQSPTVIYLYTVCNFIRKPCLHSMGTNCLKISAKLQSVSPKRRPKSYCHLFPASLAKRLPQSEAGFSSTHVAKRIFAVRFAACP